MKTATYTRTTVETVEGILLTAENMFEVANELAALPDVSAVDFMIKLGSPSMTVRGYIMGSTETFRPGDIITTDDRGKKVRHAYPRHDRGEWKAQP